MAEAELPKVESVNKALDRPDRIVCSNIVLNPSREETGLLTALAGLEWAIRHEPNRTSTLKKTEFLPSLDGQITQILSSPRAKNISVFPKCKSGY
jgi:hypothetical protein